MKLPASLLGAALLGMAAPVAAAPLFPGIPLPDLNNPIVSLLLSLVAAAVAPPAAWLAWMVARLAGTMTAASLRALAAFIENHTQRTTSTRDDAAGASMARDLRRTADRVDADADRKAKTDAAGDAS